MATAARADSPGAGSRGGRNRVTVLTLLALLALPGSSPADETAPTLKTEPTKELFVYAGVMKWETDFWYDSDYFDVNVGSKTWVIGLGPRLWPDQDNRVYAAGAAELVLHNGDGAWGTLTFEGGVGF